MISSSTVLSMSRKRHLISFPLSTLPILKYQFTSSAKKGKRSAGNLRHSGPTLQLASWRVAFSCLPLLCSFLPVMIFATIAVRVRCRHAARSALNTLNSLQPSWHWRVAYTADHRLITRNYVTTAQEVENINVGHSRFLAEASKREGWKNGEADKNRGDAGRGKLSPTASHLFKLIIPLQHTQGKSNDETEPNANLPPPIVFLLHPSQPLSHVSRLILASLAPATPSISFRSTTPRGHPIQWSDSTDVADFIRDAARTREFTVCITDQGEDEPHTTIPVEVPSFEDRTRFLRRRLFTVEQELDRMEVLKRECDEEAHRGARRMSLGGFGILIVYWGAVARLTFWDYGWDVMEPITYLSSLSMVILGYLWCVYGLRIVKRFLLMFSYSSVLHHSVSARREALHKARGLDIDRWTDLVNEAKTIRREMSKIAEDYDQERWKESEEEIEAREKNEIKGPEDVEETEEEKFELERGRRRQ
ncbi:hypothetical protein C8Q74DRAFT_1282002 [Fomes fomentarius]|nr:hypothetical protein C8Q74DRAFT_1282002 [Fomes fomentarius]